MGLHTRATLRIFAVATALCTAATTIGSAQLKPPATTLVEPPAPLMPTTDTLVVPSPDFPVPDDTSVTATILKEDGLVRAEARVVLVPTPSKPASGGWVRVYQFIDATGAMSAYTYFREGGKPYQHTTQPINATEVENADGEIIVLSGVSAIRAKLNLHSDSVNTYLSQISVGLPKIAGPKSFPPLLPARFPADIPNARLDPATLRYALGPVAYATMGGVLPADILGWDKSAEVATANYATRSGKGTVTLLLYPTPQIAADRLRAIQAALGQPETALSGTVKFQRNGPLVALTSGAFAPNQADKLVAAAHLDEIITFDKPMPLELHTEVRKTATLLQSILIFTGLMTLAAIVIAVFLGGARAGWRVMHGKPAASEPEFLTINLRDQPKALFVPKDSGPVGPSGDTPSK